MLREGSGEPLVLFHGILGSETVWRHVVPLLAEDHDVIVPTALGHSGGPRPTKRPTSIDDVIDTAEEQLDDLGLEKAHLAGNSMGGWISLEPARRGRAKSVCALSPAGFWEEGWAERDRAFRVLTTARREARRDAAWSGPSRGLPASAAGRCATPRYTETASAATTSWRCPTTPSPATSPRR